MEDRKMKPRPRKGRRKVCQFCVDKVEHIMQPRLERLRLRLNFTILTLNIIILQASFVSLPILTLKREMKLRHRLLRRIRLSVARVCLVLISL